MDSKLGTCNSREFKTPAEQIQDEKASEAETEPPKIDSQPRLSVLFRQAFNRGWQLLIK